MREQLQDTAASVVEQAERAGAQHAWAWVRRGRAVKYSYRDGAIETVQESTSMGLEVQLYVDGRYSAQSTTDLRPERLGAFLSEAVSMTRALQVDPHRQMQDPALYAGRSEADLELSDGAVVETSHEARLDVVRALDEAAHRHQKVISATSGVNHDHSVTAGASSNGFSGSTESTSFWYGTSITVQDEGEKRPRGDVWVGGRHLAGLPEPELVGRQALGRVVQRMGSAKGVTRRANLVVENLAAARILGMLLSSATARAMQQGRSFFQGKVGERLFSESLTLTDEPLLPRGLASRPFDGEGIASRRLPIVEGGVVRNVYVDTYYGRKLGLAPTTGSGSNRVVRPGKGDLAAVLKKAGKGVLVTEWLGGNADPTSGDFSLGVAGFDIVGGQIGAPIGEMNLTGNLVTLFNSLVALGDDVHPYSSTLSPSLLFEGVQFSGA